MKKKIVLLLVVVGSVMAVSAEGRQTKENNNKAMTERGTKMEKLLKDAEILTITGKLELINGEDAKIESKGITYTIRAPWTELADLELKDGQTITLKGIEKQPRMQWDDSEKDFILTVVIIEDKEITIDLGNRRGHDRVNDNNNRGERKGN